MEDSELIGGSIFGKIVIEGRIKLKTGLHIGAQTEVVEIGGLDNPILKDPATDVPYIPGSSFKGKLRSLLEKRVNAEKPEEKRGRGEERFFNREVGSDVWMHICNDYKKAKTCPVCRLFGSSGSRGGTNHPSRVIFRDAYALLSDDQNPEDIIEIKYETSIDRVTSAANPRPMERVVPGTEFGFEIVYNIEDENDKEEDLRNLISLMKMLEDDYLGGSGSRGYGKVEIYINKIAERSKDYYLREADERIIFANESGERPEKVISEINGKL
ncbi:MAG: CRISPR-associated protein Csm3 [Archaeoglobi archaeon]|nr:CRISPR-associated protein Csm3 [Archaeoglobi archaeon]